MPVTFTYKDINNAILRGALKKLGNHYPYRDVKLRHSIEKLIRKWDQEVSLSRDMVAKETKAYAALDENGNLKIDPNSPLGIETLPGKEADLLKMLEDFDKIEFTIQVHKIQREQLDEVALSPVEMISLAPLLVDIEEVKTEDEPAKAVANGTTN